MAVGFGGHVRRRRLVGGRLRRRVRLAVGGIGDAAVEPVAQLVGVVSVWSRRLRATTTPVAAVTPATPARPTIFQGTFMGA